MARQAKRTRYILPPVEDLHYGEHDSQARDRDWSEGYTESWDYIAASRCEKCGEVVFGVMEADYPTHEEADYESSCDGKVYGASPPMMNYLYPLTSYRGTANEAAVAIIDLPLCIVTDGHGEVEGMALTGGGMDLSWEIAEAYMRLGYLPPVRRLPAQSDRGESETDLWIAAAMRRSIEAQRASLDRDLEELDRTLAFGRESGQRRRRARAPRIATSPHGRCKASRTCLEHAVNPDVSSCKGRGKGRKTS